MGKDQESVKNVPLNPELKARNEEIYGTERTAGPLETTHAHEGAQGEGWSLVWLIVVLVSIAFAVYFLL